MNDFLGKNFIGGFFLLFILMMMGLKAKAFASTVDDNCLIKRGEGSFISFVNTEGENVDKLLGFYDTMPLYLDTLLNYKPNVDALLSEGFNKRLLLKIVPSILSVKSEIELFPNAKKSFRHINLISYSLGESYWDFLLKFRNVSLKKTYKNKRKLNEMQQVQVLLVNVMTNKKHILDLAVSYNCYNDNFLHNTTISGMLHVEKERFSNSFTVEIGSGILTLDNIVKNKIEQNKKLFFGIPDGYYKTNVYFPN